MEIVEELTLRPGVELERRFDLHDELAVDDHVHPLPTELATFVEHWNAHLSVDRVSPSSELVLEGTFIKILEKAEAHRVVHFVERPDHGFREPCFKKVAAWHGEKDRMSPGESIILCHPPSPIA